MHFIDHRFTNRVKKGELPTSKGISYLELKFHLMLSYCTHICFYLLLKSEGTVGEERGSVGAPFEGFLANTALQESPSSLIR